MSTVAGDLAKKQDLPPPGGYKKIPFARVPQKSYLSGFQMFAAYVTCTGIGLGVYYYTAKQIRQEKIEMRSARNVGTWYGEPIYKTQPEDKLFTPSLKEFYVHADFDDYYKASTLKLWS
uniref:NADH dehydrogenase [ubiquinone] 1 alpha subcomplex subunit 13 n=1 Tax=Megaselia scalaris TaxID=36166 RepID=T1GVR9_MEGSC